jgi:protein O-GlcNAc transferase
MPPPPRRTLPSASPRRALRLFRAGSFAAAIPLLRQALEQASPHPDLPFALAHCLCKLGRIDEGLALLRRLTRAGDPEVRRAALRKIAIYVPISSRADNAAILRARRQWSAAEARVEKGTPRSPPPSPTRGRKLRIGYVTAFLDCRNWMKPVWGVLLAHDREAFEIHLFVEGGMPDRRQGYAPDRRDRVHRLDELSNEEAARRVAAAGIDILVDLNALAWPRRLGLFLRRPAPIQIGWFNAYATSGTDAFDYAVADRVALPAHEDRFYSERILAVSGTYLAFSVLYRVPPLTAPPSQESGKLTFGCLAPHYKLTPAVIETFAEILRQAPGSRLLLKNTALDDAGNRAALLGRFQALGADPAQLLFSGYSEHYRFLQAYDRVDVALDTFPYSGGTTTSEALWQGVPVLTFRGDRWAARTTASLLAAAGLLSWICPSRAAFIARAVSLARKPPPRLAALRKGLRRNVAASAACDVGGLCRQLERHYVTLGRSRRQGERWIG